MPTWASGLTANNTGMAFDGQGRVKTYESIVKGDAMLGDHGAEPPCFKKASPRLRGRRFRKDYGKLSNACEGGELPFKAWGFSPVFPVTADRKGPAHPRRAVLCS